MTFREKWGKNEYYIKQHGLLWLVMRIIYGPMVPAHVEDSRWDSVAMASEHCRLLNEMSDQQTDAYDRPSPPAPPPDRIIREGHVEKWINKILK